MSVRSTRWTWVGLLLVIAAPELIAALSPAVASDGSNLLALGFFHLLFVATGALLLLIIVRGERLPLRSVGLRRPGWSTIETATLLFLAGLVLHAIVIGPLSRIWGQEDVEAGVHQLSLMPLWFRLGVGATSGVVEELLYRGFAIERLATLTGNRIVGAIVATVVFALAHIPAWGIGYALVGDLPAGVLLAAFYLWKRDLVANMLAHSGGLIFSMLTLGAAA